VIKSRG